MSDYSVRVTIPDIQVSVSFGLADRPTPYDKATKAEAHYRPAWTDPVNKSAALERTHDASVHARGRLDNLEIPHGAPSEEGPGEGVGTVWRKECGSCSHFRASSCDIVAGVIDHEYLCDWWEDDAEPS